jgi:hypothetical protein
MRLTSMVTISFSLLLSTVLAAQTPRSGSSTEQFAPRPASASGQSCPVHFSANRQPQGAIAYASSLDEWSRRYGNHTLEQQQQMLRNEPGFSKLTARQQRKKLDQLAALYRSDPAHLTQDLGVTVVNAENHIVAADLVVHGYAAGTRVIPAASVAQEVAETFHLATVNDHPLVDSPIRTTHIAMVNWLELTRLQFADGSTWEPSAGSRCSASPSLFVLVNSAAR